MGWDRRGKSCHQSGGDPNLFPCYVSPINNVIYQLEDCLLCCCHSGTVLTSNMPDTFPTPLVNKLVWDWPFIIKISSFHSTISLNLLNLNFNLFQSLIIFFLLSLTGCWCTFMLQFMTLSGLFVKHDKENNKSTFTYSPALWCAHNILVTKQECTAIKWRHVLLLKPHRNIQIWFMEHRHLPSNSHLYPLQ